jgi:GTP-binding protein EngB required for normal cell division
MMKGISAILGSIFAERQKRKGAAHFPEIELPAIGGGISDSIYAPNSRTLMLESVLSEQSPTSLGRTAGQPHGLDKTGARTARKIKIGDELKVAKEAITASGEMLARLLDASIAAYVARILAVTEGQHCQVAFIGQMNAGKSTLINAFIGAPDLLPSEITPWTTVVTNLYFGIPGKPTSGAVFEFFDEEEWRQLSEGSGRVRALTERLMPNFPWESFHEQVGAMREAAERRLGARYRELLGQQHVSSSLTEGLLAKYVAAQSPLAGPDDEASGEFSAITKAAHIYFDLMNFFYPTVVIDTPGINDPFLVRDEITRQNLERANIFVIVVTARQPLSNVDLDLLRILHGLRKERFIIFVNKIDEVENFDMHSETIVGRIRGLITREFPQADFTVITGCAEWATIALGQDAGLQQELARVHGIPSASAMLAGEGVPTFWLSDPAAEAATLADAILTRSGIPDLASAVSNIMHSGPIAGGLRHAASVLTAVARNGLVRAKADAELIRGFATPGAESDAGAEHRAAMLTESLDKAAVALSAIIDVCDRIERDFAAIVKNAKEELSARLSNRLSAHLHAPIENGGDRRDVAASSRHWGVTELRTVLEAEFARVFEGIVSAIGKATMLAEQSVADKVALAGDLLDMRIEYPLLPALKCSPSLAALAEPISIEFGGVAYASSWAKLSMERKQHSLGLVEAEFAAMIEKLVQSAREELERTVHFILDHFRSNALSFLQFSIEQRRMIISECWGGAKGDATARSQQSEAMRDRLYRLESEARAFDAVLSRLGLARFGEKD